MESGRDHRDAGHSPAPNLVIPDIVLTQIHPGDVASTLSIRVVVVRNVGDADAQGCTVALGYSANLTGSQAMGWSTEQITNVIKPGGSQSAIFGLTLPYRPGTPWQGLLIAVVDPPVPGHPSGQIREHERSLLAVIGPATTEADVNNVFGVIFNTGGPPEIPVHWSNPAFP